VGKEKRTSRIREAEFLLITPIWAESMLGQ
jgi:hypothetical protein